jgi:DNA-binding CsgD family transcriptional regulator
VNSTDVLELVRSRSSPGVLIFSLDQRLLYSNREALSFFGSLDEVPPEVIELCKGAELGAETGGNCALLSGLDGQSCSLRAFLIGGAADGQPASHVMVLIEKVTEKHDINLKKAKSGFGLSAREIEIVALVSRGLSNKEIGSGLFLSEHTVKDHLKNVMRKMAVSSRSEIIAMLK